MENYSWGSAFIAQFNITSHCIQQDNNKYIVSISPYGQAIGSNLMKIHCIITKPDWFIMICDSRSVPTSTLCPVTMRLWSRIDTHYAPWMTMSRCHEAYWHPIIRELEDNQIIQSIFWFTATRIGQWYLLCIQKSLLHMFLSMKLQFSIILLINYH